MELKTYYLIFLDFPNMKYTLYKYEKERKLTTRQINANIYGQENLLKVVETGTLNKNDTIEKHYQLIEKHNLPRNKTQRLWVLL